METSIPRYTMQDAENIRKAAMRVLFDARLEAVAKVRDDLLSIAGATEQELANKLPTLLAGLPLPQRDHLERVRLRLSVATFAHMVSTQLAEGVTAKSLAEFIGIDLEEFANEAWQGFEDNCAKVAQEGGIANV